MREEDEKPDQEALHKAREQGTGRVSEELDA